ncbi:MAG: hypothetical protein GEV06_18450 [Luteitalea sp.]|nr:hypothetical protein [Luteitalea sp.]
MLADWFKAFPAVSRRRARRLSLGVVLLATTRPAAPLDAQVLYGTIVGTVTDSSRAAVPGATVTATNTETNLVLTSVTNERGNFTIANALAGPYDLQVELQGFREFIQTGVPVTAGTVSRVDVTLEIGTLAETVTVASSAALLQTDRADVHTELRSKEITDVPLPAYRNYQSLMNLVPGATPATVQNDLTDTPARSLRTFVNGQHPNNNATTTDGATNVNPWLPHHVMFNHTLFGNPSGSVTSSTFMHIFNTAVAPRTIRLGPRFSL